MSRERFISSGIWSSRDFSTLSLAEARLFMGLFSTCDDWGRIKADPYPLLHTFFREMNFSEDDIVKFTDVLAKRHMVERYLARDGIALLWLPAFHKYQPMRYHTKSHLDRHPKDKYEFCNSQGKPIALAPCGKLLEFQESAEHCGNIQHIAGNSGTLRDPAVVVDVVTVVDVVDAETDGSTSSRRGGALKLGELGTDPETTSRTMDLIPVDKKKRSSKRSKKKMPRKKKQSAKQKQSGNLAGLGEKVALLWKKRANPATGCRNASERSPATMRKAGRAVMALALSSMPELVEDHDELFRRIIVEIDKLRPKVRAVASFDWVFVKGNLAKLLNGEWRKSDGKSSLESWKGKK